LIVTLLNSGNLNWNVFHPFHPGNCPGIPLRKIFTPVTYSNMSYYQSQKDLRKIERLIYSFFHVVIIFLFLFYGAF